MLILIFLALLICGGVFYMAWKLSSGEPSRLPEKEEPGDVKE
jgi:hypothetical protein